MLAHTLHWEQMLVGESSGTDAPLVHKANHGCRATQSLNKLGYLRYKWFGVVHVVCMYHSQFVSQRPGGLQLAWRWRTSPLPCETLVYA